jgi:hypothetical protein
VDFLGCLSWHTVRIGLPQATSPDQVSLLWRPHEDHPNANHSCALQITSDTQRDGWSDGEVSVLCTLKAGKSAFFGRELLLPAKAPKYAHLLPVALVVAAMAT